MKVIKAAIDLKMWSLKCVCPNCTSELEVETTDIYYDYNGKEPPWRTQCCLCDKQFRITEDQLPKLVQADITKHRYVSSPSSDW